MSDFFHDPTEQRCAKQRPCIWCAEPILKGQIYTRQSGVWEGSFFTSHYHPECFGAMAEDDDSSSDGFMPYSNERPPSAADLEINSWDSTVLFQERLL